LNGIIAIDDERARDGVRRLAREGIVAGECGAAGIGGLRAWIELAGEPLPGRRALVISTEGATDPDAYATITSNISRGAQRAEELGENAS
jgi:diaminopropionate ammonia-lyase